MVKIICASIWQMEEARQMTERLKGLVSFYKVGMLLYLAGGSELVQKCIAQDTGYFWI